MAKLLNLRWGLVGFLSIQKTYQVGWHFYFSALNPNWLISKYQLSRVWSISKCISN